LGSDDGCVLGKVKTADEETTLGTSLVKTTTTCTLLYAVMTFLLWCMI